jgi:hypothetical protein
VKKGLSVIMIALLITLVITTAYAGYRTKDQVWSSILNSTGARTEEQVLNAAFDETDSALKIGLIDPAGVEDVATGVIQLKLTDGKIYDFMNNVDSLTYATNNMTFYSDTVKAVIPFTTEGNLSLLRGIVDSVTVSGDTLKFWKTGKVGTVVLATP